MRIGVEEPVDDDLVEVCAKELARKAFGVDILSRQRCQRRDLSTFHQFHGEDAAAGVVLNRFRDDDPGEFPQVLADRRQVVRLALVIQFLQHRTAELVDDSREVELRPRRRMAIEKTGDLLHHREVLGHALADAGALNLDRDLAAVAELRAMHLPQRRRGNRLRVKGRKAFRQPHAEVFLDDAFDVGERERLEIVLQPGQRVQIGRWQEVGPCGEELPQFDEGGSELFEVRCQFARILAIVSREQRLPFERLLQTGFADKIGTAVLIEDPCDVRVAFQPRGAQGKGHVIIIGRRVPTHG